MFATHTSSNCPFDLKILDKYDIKPDATLFYKSMIDRGHKIDINEKSTLDNFNLILKTRSVSLKTVFEENSFVCNNFFIIMHEKYDIDYIKYKLIFDSILQTPHITKNLYRYVWRHYQEIKSQIHHLKQPPKDPKHEKLITWIIENDFKYPPELIEDIYNSTKLQKKILDSFFTFSKNNNWAINFVLSHMHKYFLE